MEKRSRQSSPRSSRTCCVEGCFNTSINSPPDTQFYSFSVRDYKKMKREMWINAVDRRNPDGTPWQPNNNARICSNHFIGNKKSEQQSSPSYVPTIFPSKDVNVHWRYRKEAIERSKNRKQTTSTTSSRILAEVTNYVGNADNSEDLAKNCLKDAPPVKHMQNQATQVQFFENVNSDCKIFICNRIVTNNICEAEVQACIPTAENVKKTFKKIVKVKDSSCGPTVKTAYIHQSVGPEAADLNVNSLLKCHDGFHGFSSIKTDQEMVDLCGVTLANFQLMLKIMPQSKGRKLSKENNLLIFLMKMKLGITFSALGVLFNVHRTTISRTFFTSLKYLAKACANFVKWPSREAVQTTMPDVFKDTYKDCRVIIDCTEIKVEQPPKISDRVHLYSHYKKDFTIKVLVGCAPNGVISFVSKCYGGRTTDAQITNDSGFLELLEQGDLVLADKGFPEIKTALKDDGRGVLIVMPPFLHNGEFTAEEVAETYKTASIRIHVERIIQRIKTYRILNKLPVRMLPHCDDILFMCCVLANLQPPIIKESDNDEQ